uniref:Uncharacterized protein n=1 Tax=Amphimedon queenslandica TaxID=400682 RepID=A0AAN0JYW5_AMPQE
MLKNWAKLSVLLFLGGPLSISGEVARAINLSGLREVCIRRVDKDEKTLDLVVFIFKIDKGVYISRKLLFAGMLLRVSGLWTKGETVKSGVHGDWGLYLDQPHCNSSYSCKSVQRYGSLIPMVILTLMKHLMVREGSLLRLEGVIPLINSLKGVRPLIERYRTHNSSRISTSLRLMLPKTRAERTRLVT